MIHGQNTKVVNVSPPVAIIDNASAVTTVIDTLGWDYCQVFCFYGVTDIATVALKMQESEGTTNATTLDGNAADITGLVFGTSTNIAGSTSALPASTADNNVYRFDIDLKNRKRYLDLVATLGDGAAGTFFTACAILSRGGIAPTTAAQSGCGDILRV